MESGSEKVGGNSYLAERGDHSGSRGRRDAKAKDNILALRTKVQAAEDELRQLGFVLDDEGMLDLIPAALALSGRLNVVSMRRWAPRIRC